MRRIFLDVGAHEGQTLAEVTHERYGFDHIFAFEPMPRQFAQLRQRFERNLRVTLCNFGLSDNTGIHRLYGTNDDMEASLYPSKADVDASVSTPCTFVRASEFVREWLSPADQVVMKLNCEGGEIPILTDLLDTGAIDLIDHLMVDFDCRKIVGLEGSERPITRRLKKAGVDFVLSEDVMQGETHQLRIGNWLAGALA